MNRISKILMVGTVICSCFSVYADYSIAVASDAEMRELKEKEASNRLSVISNKHRTSNILAAPASLPAVEHPTSNEEGKYIPRKVLRDPLKRLSRYFQKVPVDIEKKFAESLVNTLVRKMTVKIRKTELPMNQRKVMEYKISRDEIEIRYGAVIEKGTITREQCRIVFPDKEVWQTNNGKLTSGSVSEDDIKDALAYLKKAGFKVNDVSIGIPGGLVNRKGVNKAEKLIVNLELAHCAIIGKSSDSETIVNIGVQELIKRKN